MCTFGVLGLSCASPGTQRSETQSLCPRGQFRVEVLIWTKSIFDALYMDLDSLRFAVAPLFHTWLAWRDLFATCGA